MIYLFTFSNLSYVVKGNERSGKHVQHLEVFLFFNLIHCYIHFIVTLQPFLNTPSLSIKPPPPPFCPSFLVMRRLMKICQKNLILFTTSGQITKVLIKIVLQVYLCVSWLTNYCQVENLRHTQFSQCPHTGRLRNFPVGVG